MSSSFEPAAMLYVAIAQCALALILSVRKNRQFVNPYNAFLIGATLSNIGNIKLLDRIHNGTNYMYGFASVNNIKPAAVIWTISNCIFFIGYLLADKKSLPSIGLKFDRSLLDKLFYILVAFSLPIVNKNLFFLPNAVSKVVGLAGLIGILFFARLWARDENTKYRNYAFILFAIQMYTAIANSYLRFLLVMPVFVLYAGYLSGKDSFKSIISYRLIPLFIFGYAFFSAFDEMGKSRSGYGNILIKQFAIVDDDDEEYEELMNSIEMSNDIVDRGGALDRLSTLAQVSSCIRLVNDNGFYNGAASAPVVTAVIPRFLWPDKPIIALGQWFAVAVGAAYVTDRNVVNNSINMTIPGELYLDFGWFGIVFGCLLFGLFFRMLWNCCQFDESAFNFNGTVFGGYIILLAISGISGDLQILINYLSFYLVFYLVKKLLCAYFV